MFNGPFQPPRPSPSLLSFPNFSLPVPRIISYNVNSLSFYSTSIDLTHRRNLVSACIRDLLASSDIVCLQETNLATHETQALFSIVPHSAVSLNNLKMHEAGTAIIDSPSILRFYDPTDVALPANLKGYVQLRRYTPRAAPHQPFQLFNVYFKTGQGKSLVHEDLVSSMLKVEPSIREQSPARGFGPSCLVNKVQSL